MSTRTYARILAFQFLFCLDFRPVTGHTEVESFILNKGLNGNDHQFYRDVVTAVIDNRDAIDAIITKGIEHWDIERLVATDKAVLRLGVGEMCFSRLNTPRNVVINECIEIAKRFGTDDSGKFINGVLDKIQVPAGVPAAAGPQ